MASIDLIRASNGSGDAVKATVANARVISSTTLQVDATTNWPSKFIATVGDVDGTGAFVPATVTVFNGILSGSNIEITSFAPGYTDLGNTPGQIVVLKPTTAWANEVASTLGVAHNDDGTLKANSVTSTALADSNVTTPKIADGAVTAAKIDYSTIPLLIMTMSPAAYYASGAGTVAKFNTTKLDQSNGAVSYNMSTGEMTINTAGVYLVTANMLFSTAGQTTGTYMHSYVVYDGVTAAHSGTKVGNGANNETGEWSGSFILPMAVGKKVIAYIGHNDSASRPLNVGSTLAIYKIA